MELHHGKERKECERMECKSGISCEKAFLDHERSVDAFCVKMKFSCAVGKKSGRNVIKEKFVVCSSIAFLFVFFPLSSFFSKLKFPLRRITSLHQTPFSSCIYTTHKKRSNRLATSFTRKKRKPNFFFQVQQMTLQMDFPLSQHRHRSISFGKKEASITLKCFVCSLFGTKS